MGSRPSDPENLVAFHNWSGAEVFGQIAGLPLIEFTPLLQRVTANRADINMHVRRDRRRVVERADTDETESRDSGPAACTRLMRKRSSTAELSIVVVRSTAKCRPPSRRAGGHESDQKDRP